MHSLEAEQAVLGSIFLDNECLEKISLQPEDFWSEEHRSIFKCILGCTEAFDALIACQSLGEEEQAYALSLEYNTPSVSNVVEYAKVVRNWAILRSLKSLGEDIALKATNPNRATETLHYASDKIAAMESGGGQTIKGQTDLLLEVVDRFEMYANGTLTGLKTHFNGVDLTLNPLEGGSLTIVAGRPAMGKTAFACQVLMEHALAGRSVALFSLEMSAAQIMERNLSNLGRIDLNELRSGTSNDKVWCSIVAATHQLKGKSFFIDERVRTISQLRQRCYEIKRDVGLDLICVDYLQLMSADSAENRTTEISTISRGLKTLAMDMKIPVIALSQLNRGLEQRQDKRPMMSDLRESGAIEQDADNILFIYRDEVYNEFSADKGRAEIIISKQRNGPTGSTKLAFLGPYTRFES